MKNFFTFFLNRYPVAHAMGIFIICLSHMLTGYAAGSCAVGGWGYQATVSYGFGNTKFQYGCGSFTCLTTPIKNGYVVNSFSCAKNSDQTDFVWLINNTITATSSQRACEKFYVALLTQNPKPFQKCINTWW